MGTPLPDADASEPCAALCGFCGDRLTWLGERWAMCYCPVPLANAPRSRRGHSVSHGDEVEDVVARRTGVSG